MRKQNKNHDVRYAGEDYMEKDMFAQFVDGDFMQHTQKCDTQAGTVVAYELHGSGTDGYGTVVQR